MTTLDEADLEAARSAVAPLAELRGLDADLERYQPLRWTGRLPRLPLLSLDDVSAIPFLVGIAGVEEYQHRARLRAGSGDLFGAGTPQTAGYETYCREGLGLGDAEFILAPSGNSPLAVARALSQGPALDRIVDVARSGDGLIIHPYMGIESVWELGRRVAEESERPVTILAPPTPVTWIANDKSAFGDVVRRVLGNEWLVETWETREPADLAVHLTDLAGRHSRVALKRLRCASAMGNAVFASRRLLALGPDHVREQVDDFLARTEWRGDEDVQAVAWEETDLSPSTQLWIPPPSVGPPRLDGVYEQILEGEHGVFIGSRPSTLSASVNAAMGRASLAVAAGLQALGYVGRCSFDLLVVGDPAGDFELRFTECNGRWGGTSTPMALLDRLLDGPRPPYRAQDFVHQALVGMPFTEILDAAKLHLFDPATGKGHFIFYNVGPLAESGKLDVIAIGESQQHAEELVEMTLPELLGL